MSLGNRRTLDELAAAIVYLELMEDNAKDDPINGKIVGTVASKGRHMLQWAAGEDNRFGEMVARFIGQAGPSPCVHQHARRSRKSDDSKRQRLANPKGIVN